MTTRLERMPASAAFPWVTLVLVASTLLCYAYARRRVPEHRLMLSFHRTVSKGELWLPCVSALAHTDLVHLSLDLTVLASLYLVELSLGSSLRYLEACVEVFLLTLSVQMWVYWAFGRRLAGTMLLHAKSIGCTSYVIGILVMHAQQEDYFEFVLYKGLRVHTSNAPMLVYILATCLARDASILGHLGAGFAGWVVGSGGLSFLHGYFFVCLISWLFVATLVSLKETTFLKAYLQCVRVKSWPPWEDGDGSGEGAAEDLVEERNGDDSSNNVNDGGGRGAATANREPRIRTVVNDEPFVQWVAATRMALALARDQAEVDAAESKASEAAREGNGEEGDGIEMVVSGGSASGGMQKMSGVSSAVLAQDSGLESEFSSDDEGFSDADLEDEDASLLRGGETKRKNSSSRFRRVLGDLRRKRGGGRRRGRRDNLGSFKSGPDIDDLV